MFLFLKKILYPLIPKVLMLFEQMTNNGKLTVQHGLLDVNIHVYVHVCNVYKVYNLNIPKGSFPPLSR